MGPCRDEFQQFYFESWIIDYILLGISLICDKVLTLDGIRW